MCVCVFGGRGYIGICMVGVIKVWNVFWVVFFIVMV